MSSPSYPSMDQYNQNYNQSPQQPSQQQQQQYSNVQQQGQQQWNQSNQNQYATQQPAFHRDVPQYGHNPQYSPPGLADGNFDSNKFISNFSSNPLAQASLSYGINYGQTLFNGGKQYVDSNLGKYISFSSLKGYFNVNTSYVFNKIKLILFPFRQKLWKRRILKQGDNDHYLPPRDDINAPDLYIPMMAFVTYFLLFGFQMGMKNSFSPDKLGASISKGIIFWLLEIGFFKLGFFFTNSYSIPMYDMIAYSGYKYVLLVLTMVATMLAGGAVSLFVRLYTIACIGWFMICTLRVVLLNDNNMHSDMHHFEGTTKRKYFVFAVAILQVVLILLYSF
ncbi:hypothetical protein PPL_05580 [Heterostelium album PN500]|uniref:Protein YIF1 n=1 Tax=Heterostelium pallidum (strain ATCC 26659 / Pp 5 / PN500) TaxID=670386 RepID=D3BAK2_HETP5|nr:hypothetical protein PPL_05580 [Heterostelium album PN500]EFA81589.1 hypothetical protein PPL_05580 [Heterostelium album PN500]|eukprot:XP_020433706.1 hypothetical protein PPL_05580 [Heterostelium album PN500]